MHRFRKRQLAGYFTALALSVVHGVLAGEVTFKRVSLKTVAETNMGHVPVVDINGDGVVDIVAGLQWFEGPSWKRHPLYPPASKPTDIDIGFTVPYDLDRDGDLDLTAHRRSSDDRRKNELLWFENPGPPSTGIWTRHHITWDTRWPEIIVFVDIDGDGRDEMVCSDVCPGKGIRIYEIPKEPKTASNWSWTPVDKSPLHGLGIGDLNEDGRLDIVSDFVWFERRERGKWVRHSLPSPGSARRGHETMQIEVYDVDGDGDEDLLIPRAHHYGAYWLESSGGRKPSFKLHEILPGKLPSQLHGVAYADIDGDGDLDIFAGKSRYRHGDPGNDDPLDVFWIELVRSGGRVTWVKHQLATDLTMGIGPTIADVDADGDMDLVLRGHGIGGRYVIGTRQTDVTLFIQQPQALERRRGGALPPPGTGHRAAPDRGETTKRSDRVRISPRNPCYFEYRQKPLFLTGARELEMLPRVGNYPYERAVDELAKAGCTHWRIEMYISDSDREGARKYPIESTYKGWWHDPVTGKQEHLDAFGKNAKGKYDLNVFNEPFWKRFRSFCELCADKGIVLTVEMWSTYTIWATSPFNPKNNVNYAGPLDVGRAGRDADSKFVRTVPGLDHRPEVLKYQERFARKILDCTWQAGNVLYVCGNENGWPREWVEYWADFVHAYGKSKGVRLLYSNIPEHIWKRVSRDRVEFHFSRGMADILTRPQYDFADMSQFPGGTNPPFKMTRYETVADWYERSKSSPKPITILKNYVGLKKDADAGEKRREALEYFMAGAAMSGFHRPCARATKTRRWNDCADKMRKVYLASLEAAGDVAAFTSGVEFVDTSPRNDLVSGGWCLANPGTRCIVYLKKGGESVDLKLGPGSYLWKAFDGQRWSKENSFTWSGGRRTFRKAGDEDWGLYIVRKGKPNAK